ncbi:Cold-shock DNA-binding domain protein [Lysobacter dokdonensis DS-58]|uniref:Cold-shock DNA-binding domain protein n=2 Tax=Noviluteimonas TaxID=3382693 RepID=A0A0A2WGU3_9GAMM|nr:Cold-shock DNA-binding domain protein [Lysobacter dokdonensis DS-58]
MGQAFGLMSGFAFLIYWMDKAAAQRQGRRVAENSLHLLALLCGWPGALLAQGLLRHKTQKMAFQLVFWLTVIANVGVMGWLLSSRA